MMHTIMEEDDEASDRNVAGGLPAYGYSPQAVRSGLRNLDGEEDAEGVEAGVGGTVK